MGIEEVNLTTSVGTRTREEAAPPIAPAVWKKSKYLLRKQESSIQYIESESSLYYLFYK